MWHTNVMQQQTMQVVPLKHILNRLSTFMDEPNSMSILYGTILLSITFQVYEWLLLIPIILIYHFPSTHKCIIFVPQLIYYFRICPGHPQYYHLCVSLILTQEFWIKLWTQHFLSYLKTLSTDKITECQWLWSIYDNILTG